MSLRRITILLDRSSSMAGTPIGQAAAFIEWSLVFALGQNRHLYDQVELGLIAFDTSAEWLVRHSYVGNFTFPSVGEITPFGGSSLRVALELLAEDIEMRGDTEADLIVLISDGNFLDDICESTDRFSEKSKALRVSFAVDASFRHPLAYFENWPMGGRRAAEDVFNATPQDIEAMLARI